MKAMRWLAAVAGVALLAGVPAGAVDAATRAKTTVKAKKSARSTRRVVRRRAVRPRATVRATVRVPVVAAPVVPDPSLYVGPPPEPDYAVYRWLDDADAMVDAIGRSPPDVTFAEARAARYAWIFNDGAVVIAEPLGASERRWYFFERDTTVPFLVRDVDRSFAFERGRLAVLYDRDGLLLDWRAGDPVEAEAADLVDRGRRLWFAARTPRPLPPPQQLSGWSLQFGAGGAWGDNRWRDNGGWRAYRDRAGEDRRGRDERYAREREDRAARMARGGGDNRPGSGRAGRSGAGDGGASSPVVARPAAGAERPPRDRRDAPAVVEAPRPAVPPGQPGAFERVSTEPTGERPARRPARGVEPAATAPEQPVAAEPLRAPREAPEPEMRVPRRERAAEIAAPEPAPRAAPEPEAAPRQPEPTPVPVQAATPVEAPPAPPAPAERERPLPPQARHGDVDSMERPQ